MIRFLAPISILAFVAACDAPQPFEFGADATDETEENLDPTDPNVTVDNKFAFDRERGLTMNSVEYDRVANELIINNLPFDGPAGRYVYLSDLGGGGLYESLQTATTGRVKHYAVFLESDHIIGAAAAGEDWVNYGYGGANIVRDSFSAPISGEYVYVGNYSGVRTFEDRSGIELVSGDARILLDVDDFDPVDGIQGAIVGEVRNRNITTPSGQQVQGTGRIGLTLIEFQTEDGVFNEGVAVTALDDGRTEGSTGTFEGFLAGPDSIEMAANVVIEGPAYSQNVAFDVVTYSITTETTSFVPGTGMVTVTNVSTGTAQGLTNNNAPTVQDLVNAGAEIPYLEYNPIDIPAGAEITETRTETRLFTSEFDAREIGIFVATQTE